MKVTGEKSPSAARSLSGYPKSCSVPSWPGSPVAPTETAYNQKSNLLRARLVPPDESLRQTSLCGSFWCAEPSPGKVVVYLSRLLSTTLSTIRHYPEKQACNPRTNSFLCSSFVSGYPGEKVVVYPSRPVDTSLDMGSNEPTPVGNTANPASGQQRRFQQQGGDQSGSGQGGGTAGSRLGPVRIEVALCGYFLLGESPPMRKCRPDLIVRACI